jgi:hypothetical protein
LEAEIHERWQIFYGGEHCHRLHGGCRLNRRRAWHVRFGAF